MQHVVLKVLLKCERFLMKVASANLWQKKIKVQQACMEAWSHYSTSSLQHLSDNHVPLVISFSLFSLRTHLKLCIQPTNHYHSSYHIMYTKLRTMALESKS